MSVIVCDIVEMCSSCQKTTKKVPKNKPCYVCFVSFARLYHVTTGIMLTENDKSHVCFNEFTGLRIGVKITNLLKPKDFNRVVVHRCLFQDCSLALSVDEEHLGGATEADIEEVSEMNAFYAENYIGQRRDTFVINLKIFCLLLRVES